MPLLTRSRFTPWTPLLVGALVLAGLAGGWWLGQRQGSGRPSSDPRRAVLEREASSLRLRLERREASDADRQRLLELLIGLDRKTEAIALLEPMADREPDRWSLRLLLGELRRDRNDRSGAERELRLILNRKPDQIEALQLMTLLLVEQGRAGEAETQLRQVLAATRQPQVRPEALGVGLLLAELQQRRKQPAQAEATYRQLALDFPQDQRPLLGLALLHHDRGDGKGAQEALAQARLRSPDPDKPDPRLDHLAASWGLSPLRSPKPPGSPPTRPVSPVPTAPRSP